MNPLKFLLVVLPLLGLVSCQTVSRLDRRISAHAEWYNDLSPEHRELVRSARIDEGMTQNGVFLAWGSPSEVLHGSKDGQKTEVWVYDIYEPHYHQSVSFGFGYGGGRHCNYGYGGGFGYYPRHHTTVHWDREPGGQVRFVDGKVKAWEARYR